MKHHLTAILLAIAFIFIQSQPLNDGQIADDVEDAAILEAIAISEHIEDVSILPAADDIPESDYPKELCIEWSFTTYKEPNFKAEIVGDYLSHTVTVLEENDAGWGLIETYKGNYWTYLRNDPIAVKDDLDEFLRKYGDSVSVYYENIYNGYTYTSNSSKFYYAASIIKAPYVLYIYNLADKGEADLSKEYTYTSANYQGGSGAIQHMPYGTVLTEGELLGYCMTNSDNVAFRMLLGAYGVDGFKSWISDMGGNANNLRSLTDASMNAMDLGFYASLLYDYIERPGINNEKLKNDMLNASSKYIKADFPLANKHGKWDAALHDMAIIYSDSPYILVIMTNKSVANVPASQEAIDTFSDISQKFGEINRLFE